jgi:hypothetical protein
MAAITTAPPVRTTPGSDGAAPVRRTVAKAAELASGLGAIVLGAGLALVAPAWLRGHGSVLLLAGVLVHGLGMSQKYRIETNDGGLLWWERALFWLCWIILGGLGAWIAVQLATLPMASTGTA